MNIIVIGAGELGRLLASALSEEDHDVVVVDSDADELARIADKFDAMTVAGSCSSVSTLKQAGAENADAVLAVSGDEAANILACQIANKLGVKHTVCRLYSNDCFSEDDGISPATYGLWRTFSSPEESAQKILAVLANPITLESINFTRQDAAMLVLEITRSSVLQGVRIRDIPGPELLRKIRFAALVRDRQLLIPHGDTLLIPGDRVYVAGRKEDIDAFVDWATPENAGKPSRIIVSGDDDASVIVARKAHELGFGVRMIVRDEKTGERIQDEIPPGIMVLHGDPTDESLLEDAGIAASDVFVSVTQDDEENILSCIIAKRLGAKKVISLTHRPEYIRIAREMDPIDCAFSATLVAANSVLRLLEGGNKRVDVQLQSLRAAISEFRIAAGSPLCGKAISAAKLPASLVLALVFRGSEIFAPAGDTVLLEGDVVVAVVTRDTLRMIDKIFPAK